MKRANDEDLLASVSKRRKTITADISDTLVQIVRCPVCKNVYDKPIILPKCGHSICLGCAKKLSEFEDDNNEEEGDEFTITTATVTCPDCKLANPVNFKKESLKRNVTIEKVAELCADSSYHGGTEALGEGCPHAGMVTKATTFCDHCDKEFCTACVVSHVECLKLEATWIVSDFEGRHQRITEKLEETVKCVENSIESEVEAIRAEIETCTEKLIEDFKAAVLARKESLISQLAQFKGEQLEELHELRAKAIDKENVDKAVESLKKLKETSPLYCTLGDAFSVLQEAEDADDQIREFEYLSTAGKLRSKIVFDPSTEQKASLMKRIDKCFHVKKEEQDCQDVYPYEFSRLDKALLDGRLEEVETILARPNLPPDCRRFIVESCNVGGTHGPVIRAVKSGSLELVKFLVEKGADVYHSVYNWDLSEFGSSGNSAFWAAFYGKLEILKYLIEVAPNTDNILDQTDDNDTILHWAAAGGHVALIEFLIDEKKVPVDIHGEGKGGRTPLLMAANLGKIEAVRCLIKKGAEITGVNGSDVKGVVKAAISGGHTEVVRTLLTLAPKLLNKTDRADRETLLHAAVNSGKLEVVKCLLDLPGVEIDHRNEKEFNTTPLMWAAIGGNLEMAKLLLEHGADLAAVDIDGRTTLHFAAWKNAVDIVKFILVEAPNLLEARCAANLETAFDVALRSKSWDVLPLLALKDDN